jgi:hypothetical protein
VDRLAASIAAIGLQVPPTVRPNADNTALVLIAGAHRLAAAIKLGIEWVKVEVVEWDERKCRLWEISENLDRAELTALEHDQHVAEWIRLSELPEEKPTQVVPVSKPKGGRGKQGGIKKAARELNINREEARRAVKVDSLSPEAKKAAVKLKLDDNRSALLKAAKEETPAEQIQVLKALTVAKARPRGKQARDDKRLPNTVMDVLRAEYPRYETCASPSFDEAYASHEQAEAGMWLNRAVMSAEQATYRPADTCPKTEEMLEAIEDAVDAWNAVYRAALPGGDSKARFYRDTDAYIAILKNTAWRDREYAVQAVESLLAHLKESLAKIGPT